jgi:hypothetical protein
MERRDFCLDFIKGHCPDQILCKFAHVIVPDKESYLKQYEANKYKFETVEIEGQTFTLFEQMAGKKRWMTKCKGCQKGHHFEFDIDKESREAQFCKICI